MFLSAFEQLRQVRLQAKPSGISAIATVISLLQPQKVIMDIGEFIKQIAQAFILRMIPYRIFVGSHVVISYRRSGRSLRSLSAVSKNSGQVAALSAISKEGKTRLLLTDG